MFERFDEAARRALFFARFEASQCGRTAIESEHLLVGLVREGDGAVGRILHRYGVSTDDVRLQVGGRPAPEQTPTNVEMPFADEVRRVLTFAAEEADRLLHLDITREHLLLGLLRVETSAAARVLQAVGLRLADVRDQIVAMRSAPPHTPGTPAGTEVRPPFLAAFRRAVRDGRSVAAAEPGWEVSPSHLAPDEDPVVSMTPRLVTAEGFTLAELMAWAYRMEAIAVDATTMPHAERRYDVRLVLDRAESWPRIDGLLRDGLARHFAARVSRETRRMDTYVLTTTAGGEPAVAGDPPAGSGGFAVVSTTFAVVDGSSAEAERRGPNAIESFAASGLTIAQVCAALQELTGIPVVDATGRSGSVDVRVEGERDADGLVRRVAEQLGVDVSFEPRTVTMLIVRPA